MVFFKLFWPGIWWALEYGEDSIRWFELIWVVFFWFLLVGEISFLFFLGTWQLGTTNLGQEIPLTRLWGTCTTKSAWFLAEIQKWFYHGCQQHVEEHPWFQKFSMVNKVLVRWVRPMSGCPRKWTDQWLGSMGYKLLTNGVYWGYNPLANLLLTSWDILVPCLLNNAWVPPTQERDGSQPRNGQMFLGCDRVEKMGGSRCGKMRPSYESPRKIGLLPSMDPCTNIIYRIHVWYISPTFFLPQDFQPFM